MEASKALGKVFKMNEKETGLTLTKNLKRQYKDVISDQLNETPMAGKPMHIYLTEGPMLPTRVTTARAVPKNMERAALAAVDDLLKKKVITKVETPTDWCSPAFFVAKKDSNKVRMVTDFTNLNKYVGQCTPSHPQKKSCKQCPQMQKFSRKWTQYTGTSS